MRHSSLWTGPTWPPRIEGGGRRVSYIFVEDASDVTNPTFLEAPDASTFTPPHPVFQKEPFRFRTSGVRAAEFLNREGSFEVLVPGRITSEERNRRRGQLQAFFAEVGVPIIDIYVSRQDEEFRAMRMTLLAGTWHLAEIDYSKGASGGRPVYSGRATPGGENGFEGGGLVSLAPVPPPEEERLRDIFSLNHIGDSDVTPDDGSDRAPLDPGKSPPGDPPGKAEVECETESGWTVQEGECASDQDWTLDEAEAKAGYEYPRRREAHRSPAKAYLTRSN